MNSSAKDQAKNGFKTFVITFLISLLVFGAFYYVVSEASTDDVSIERDDVLGYTKVEEESTESGDVQGTKDSQESMVEDNEEPAYEESPFAALARNKESNDNGSVLQAVDETTQSTVPDTGMVGTTIGLVTSIGLFGLFVYKVLLNPRRYAMSKFEKRILKDLD